MWCSHMFFTSGNPFTEEYPPSPILTGFFPSAGQAALFHRGSTPSTFSTPPPHRSTWRWGGCGATTPHHRRTLHQKESVLKGNSNEGVLGITKDPLMDNASDTAECHTGFVDMDVHTSHKSIQARQFIFYYHWLFKKKTNNLPSWHN